jgi:hypothetical protein
MKKDLEEAVDIIRQIQLKAAAQNHGYTWADAMTIFMYLETLLEAAETLIKIEKEAERGEDR